VITLTPTPIAWSTAIAQAEAEATRRATAGPPTPFPRHWLAATPVPARRLVTSTPQPENRATSSALRARATIVALSTGTYTPVPRSWVTATPQPLLVPAEDPTPTAIPTATPGTPQYLRGKIAFWSDRYGEPRLFVMVPGHVALLTQSYPYDGAVEREPFAPDGRRFAFVQPNSQGVPQIHGFDPLYDDMWEITRMAGSAYDPAWAPGSERIAFVSAEPGNDEVYVIDADGTGLTRLTSNTWEWDKHPSWSPNGSRLVFYSNRVTGRRQLWVMNADGTGQKNISNNEYNDWDPVWIK
jgi:dipeptidyl aminopeptidase/acylaminoacyl peptidase